MNVIRAFSAAALLAAVVSVAGVEAQSLASGIGVSGHWVIQVLNPDRTVASRIEFNNHLDQRGAELLGRLMVRTSSIGKWMVRASGGARTVAFQESSNQLTVALLADQATVRMSGEQRAATGFDVTDVSTLVTSCGANNPNCNGASPVPFTSTRLPNPIRLAANQILQVQVDISFSSMP